jgi:hypothetical protein
VPDDPIDRLAALGLTRDELTARFEALPPDAVADLNASFEGQAETISGLLATGDKLPDDLRAELQGLLRRTNERIARISTDLDDEEDR